MKICSAVMNKLNNDARVLKIGNTLSESHDVTYAAVSAKWTGRLFYIDHTDNHSVLRIRISSSKTSDISNGKITRNYKQIRKSVFKQIINLPRSIRWDILLINRFYRTLISENFDMYYCNDYNTLIAGFLASRKKKAKLAYDSHELWSERNGSRKDIYTRLKRIPEMFIEGFIARRCDTVITVSEGIADEMVKRLRIRRPVIIRNLDEEKPLPDNDSRMSMRKKLGIPEDCTLLVYQGSLHPNRGIGELVQAMSSLPEHIHLLLMGSFLSEETENNISGNKRIHYLGMIPAADLHDVSSCADIGIAAIRTKGFMSHYLTFPNKFSQYMNAGLALALYRCPEAEKIISKYRCGIAFEPGSAEAITAVVRALLDSGELVQMRIRSRKGFLEEYSWKSDKGRLLAHFRDRMNS